MQSVKIINASSAIESEASALSLRLPVFLLTWWAISLSITGVYAASPILSSPVTTNNEGRLKGPSLSWEEAIRIALDKQPLIKIAQHETIESQAVTKQIESANYPQITGIYANSGGNTRVLANLGISGSLPKPVTTLTTPGVRVDLLITDFGHTAHKILSQKSLKASSEKAVLTAKALVILHVEQAYLGCLRQQRLVGIAREVLKERELIRQQAEVYHRHQLRSKLDLDFASVEVNRAELVLIKAQNDLKNAQRNYDDIRHNAANQDEDVKKAQKALSDLGATTANDPKYKAAVADIDKAIQEAGQKWAATDEGKKEIQKVHDAEKDLDKAKDAWKPFEKYVEK